METEDRYSHAGKIDAKDVDYRTGWTPNSIILEQVNVRSVPGKKKKTISMVRLCKFSFHGILSRVIMRFIFGDD